MDLIELLKAPKIDLIYILKTYKLQEIKDELNNIVSSSKGYDELKNNNNAYNNFFSLLSHIYLIEQNRHQNSVKADVADLTIASFDKNFTNKVNKLVETNENPFNLSK